MQHAVRFCLQQVAGVVHRATRCHAGREVHSAAKPVVAVLTRRHDKLPSGVCNADRITSEEIAEKEEIDQSVLD